MSQALKVMAVFFFSLMLFGGLLQTTGVASTLGVDGRLGGQGAAEDVQEQTSGSIPTGSSTGDTLFGLYNVLGGAIGDILGAVNPSLTMLANAGAPDVIIETYLIPIATLIKFIGAAYFLRGLA